MLAKSLNNFKTYLLNQELSLRTVNRHVRYIEYVLKQAPDFTKEQVDAYLASLRLRGCKNAYLNHIISSIRVYARYLNLDGYDAHFKFRKKEVFVKAVMSDEEIEAFLSLPYPGNTKPYFDYRTNEWHEPLLYKNYKMWTVFFSLMAFIGLRPSEVANLSANEFSWGNSPMVYISKGKTANSVGYLPVPPNIQELVKNYIDHLTTSKLFPCFQKGYEKTGVHDQRFWERAFKKRIEILGLKRPNLTPYSLRHSYCTSLLSSGSNMFDVKHLMRHTDLRTTEHYYHLTIDNLKKAQARHPTIRRQTDPQSIIQAMVELVKSFKIENDSRFHFRIEESDNSLRFEVYIK